VTSTVFDFDQVVIGSGFGGSVSALRLTEKGNRVLILEKGLRRADQDYPQTSWRVRDYLWAPMLGLRGPFQMSFTRKVTVLHGCGVGGGSQIYANVNLVPKDAVFESPAWARIRNDWKPRLAPFYALGLRMLGTAKNPYTNIGDDALRDTAEEFGRGDSWETMPLSIFFPQADGERDKRVADPYFAGAGPARNTCKYCAGCSLGCRHNAKNSLNKNYLFFAERNGAVIRARSRVDRIEPLAAADGTRNGSAGYAVSVVESGDGLLPRRYSVTTRGVVISAGVMGTVPLLRKMRDNCKTLPNISPLLGQQVRTNSETLLTVTDAAHELCEGPMISSGMYADDVTNIEINRFPKGSDATWLYLPYVPMVDGTGWRRGLKFLGNTLRHPLQTLQMLNPVGKARNSIVFLVMKTTESYVHLEWRRSWYRLFSRGLSAVQKAGDEKLGVYFPSAHAVARRFAKKIGGRPGNSLLEILFGTPMTAHIMGGVPIGSGPQTGVISESGEVFGYRGLRVLDGSIIPGNLGVNPSLTITALSEYAMSQIPVHDAERAAGIKPIHFSSPLAEQISPLRGEGDLLQQIIARSAQ